MSKIGFREYIEMMLRMICNELMMMLEWLWIKMKKIIIKIESNDNISQMNMTHALEVKKGLKMRPLQSLDTDREIRITRAPMKMDNAEISNVSISPWPFISVVYVISVRFKKSW